MMVFLGYKLKKLREVMGWSTTDVERMTSIPQGRISELENGNTKNPRPDTVKRLCQGLHVQDQFFFVEDDKLRPDLLPDMPEEILKFLMDSNNLPYISLAFKIKTLNIPLTSLNTIVEAFGNGLQISNSKNPQTLVHTSRQLDKSGQSIESN